MKKKLLLLNLVLMALIGLVGWQLRERWLRTQAEHEVVLDRPVKPLPPPPAPVVAPVEPVIPAAYSDVAQRMLFSRDRNPNVEQVVVEEPPMPALPAAYGFMTLDRPRVILALKPGAPQKGYSAGDQIGEFTLIAVSNKEITFEWRGKNVTRPLMELVGLGASQGPPQPEAPVAAPPPAQAPKDTLIHSGSASGPGIDMGADKKACQPGDKTPSGTIQNGMKKVMSASPFGSNCWWEPVK